MNGLVLGNDPAVHLEKVSSILQSGEISATDVGWTPPLFHILLAAFMSFIGGIGLNQMILLVKIVAARLEVCMAGKAAVGHLFLLPESGMASCAAPADLCMRGDAAQGARTGLIVKPAGIE